MGKDISTVYAKLMLTCWTVLCLTYQNENKEVSRRYDPTLRIARVSAKA